MGRSTTAQLRDKDKQLTVAQHESDAPILPMAQIERMKEVCPERVPWVFDETTKEGDFRRAENRRINFFVFVERMMGIVSGLAIGCAALFTAYRMAMAGHDWVAGIIGGTTVVGLVSVFLVRNIRGDEARGKQ